MIEYRVRSVSLLNLVNDIKAGLLIPDAYFQRNLVWREIHKKDFIKTILMGLPFPQIFISKGRVNVEDMSATSCLIDGQQRANAIMEFIGGAFDVEGKCYNDLTDREKSEFLKYEVAVIELDLENDDPKVKEIFQRINRTSNSLTAIEKLASEYSVSEFMLVAKLLAGDVTAERAAIEEFREDPNIPDSFYVWAKGVKIAKFRQLMTKKNIFSQHELSRKSHLMHVLNMMSSVLGGFYNRNDRAIEHLEDYAQEFPDRNRIVELLENAAVIVSKLGLRSQSYFYNKANIFSLMIAIANHGKDGFSIDIDKLKTNIHGFELAIPNDYKLAAQEAVNGTRARQLRNKYIVEMLENSVPEHTNN